MSSVRLLNELKKARYQAKRAELSSNVFDEPQLYVHPQICQSEKNRNRIYHIYLSLLRIGVIYKYNNLIYEPHILVIIWSHQATFFSGNFYTDKSIYSWFNHCCTWNEIQALKYHVKLKVCNCFHMDIDMTIAGIFKGVIFWG